MVLGSDSKIVGANGEVGGKIEYCVTTMIGVSSSDEFVGFKLKDEEYIKRLYTTFMGREPAASEVSYWMGEIKKGTQTKYSVMQFFGQSPEFTGICKKYGIDRGES